jgi:hypothetical protein
MFARKKKAHNVDDFQQITGDLRPFWAIAQGRRSPVICWKSSTLCAFFLRANMYHSLKPGGGCFQQITGDLRPFWAIAPAEIRQMAAKLQSSDGIAGVQIRNKKVVYSRVEGWRVPPGQPPKKVADRP